MKKLKRGFEASKETLVVKFKNDGETEIANLLKSGIVNQSIVLISHGDEWHEINALDLGLDNSDLQEFKNYIEATTLSLVDLGIKTAAEPVDYNLKHADFEQLQSEFPLFNYIQIAGLDKYEKSEGGKSGMYALREILKMLTAKNMTIEQYKIDAQASKRAIIDGGKTENPAIERYKLLAAAGLQITDNFSAVGYGFEITKKSIETDSAADFDALYMRVVSAQNEAAAAASKGIIPLDVKPDGQIGIPAVINAPAIPATIPAPPVKKPVSIETIGTLSPDRISELQGLSEKQDEVIAANPVIEITDKKTYEQAKKHAAALLKASTAIDGKDGIDAKATKYLNTFKSMLKDALTPLAKKTRDKYDEQKLKITLWENAEALRLQAEQTAKLTKIKERTDRLFAVPFAFNGELYSIGTLFVLPSQIETLPDDEFDKLVVQGQTIKTAQDSVEDAKDRQIREMRELLEKHGLIDKKDSFSPTPPEAVIEPAAVTESIHYEPNPAFVTADNNNGAPAATVYTDNTANSAAPANDSAAETATAPAAPKPVKQTGRFAPGLEYSLPAPENKILNAFDLSHASIVSAEPIPPAFIKCREYFKYGMSELAVEIQNILTDTDVTVKKSDRIKQLCEIILNQ